MAGLTVEDKVRALGSEVDKMVDAAKGPALRRLLDAAAADIEARIADVSGRLGSDRWTIVHLQAARVQVAAAIAHLQERLLDHLDETSGKVVPKGLSDVLDVLRLGERLHGSGVVPVLALDDAMVFDNATRGVRSSLLRQHQTSVIRYGNRLIGEFEKEMSLSVLRGKSTTETIDALVGASGRPGVLGTNAYWAERIVRTESLYAYNAGSQAALEETAKEDFPDLKRLISATFDRRTGEDSIFVHGQVRGINEEFVDGAGRVYLHPPARPNDRERILPWRLAWGVPHDSLAPKPEEERRKAAEEAGGGGEAEKELDARVRIEREQAEQAKALRAAFEARHAEARKRLEEGKLLREPTPPKKRTPKPAPVVPPPPPPPPPKDAAQLAYEQVDRKLLDDPKAFKKAMTDAKKGLRVNDAVSSTNKDPSGLPTVWYDSTGKRWEFRPDYHSIGKGVEFSMRRDGAIREQFGQVERVELGKIQHGWGSYGREVKTALGTFDPKTGGWSLDPKKGNLSEGAPTLARIDGQLYVVRNGSHAIAAERLGLKTVEAHIIDMDKHFPAEVAAWKKSIEQGKALYQREQNWKAQIHLDDDKRILDGRTARAKRDEQGPASLVAVRKKHDPEAYAKALRGRYNEAADSVGWGQAMQARGREFPVDHAWNVSQSLPPGHPVRAEIESAVRKAKMSGSKTLGDYADANPLRKNEANMAAAYVGHVDAIEKTSGSYVVARGKQDDFKGLFALIDKSVDLPFRVEAEVKRGVRAHCDANEFIESRIAGRGTAAKPIKMLLDAGDHQKVSWHEFGHAIEASDRVRGLRASAFLDARSGREATESLASVTGIKAYAPSERTRKDKFVDAYVGKDYGRDHRSYYRPKTPDPQIVDSTKAHFATEVTSMGIEDFARPSVMRYEKDVDFFHFALGQLGAH